MIHALNVVMTMVTALMTPFMTAPGPPSGRMGQETLLQTGSGCCLNTLGLQICK